MKKHPGYRPKSLRNKPKKSPVALRETEKNRKTQESAHAGKLRYLTGAAVAGVLGLAGVCILSGPDKSKTDTSVSSGLLVPEKPRSKLTGTAIEPYKPQGDEEVEQMKHLQEYWKKVSLEALNRFINADPIMPRLYEFFEKNAEFSIPMGPVATMHFSSGDTAKAIGEIPKSDNQKFEVVFMPEKYADGMKSSIITENHGRTMRVAANFKCKEWLGIMLAHELSHVYNLLIEGEDPYQEQQYYAGEVKAHSLEMRLLRAWSPEVYEELIRGTQNLDRKSGAKMKEFDEMADRLYPLESPYVGDREGRLGYASLLISAKFELARRRGATDKDLEGLYKYLGEFMR